MPVRRWNDDDSRLEVPVVAASDLTTTLSIVALIRPEAKASFESALAAFNSIGGLAWSFGTNGSNIPFFYTAWDSHLILPSAGGAITDGSYWLIAYCQQEGSAGVFRICELGGAPQHITADGEGVALTSAGGFLSFGGTDGSDDLDALYAVAALGGVFLSQATFNALAAAAATSDLLSAGLAGVWDFDQADAGDDVPDLMGGHATISGAIDAHNGITGTTIVTGSDPAWAFGAAAAGEGLQLRSGGGWVSATRLTRAGGAWV